MWGGRRQQRRRQVGEILRVLACSDGTSRVCGHAHANMCAGYLLTGLNCWRASAEDKGFAGRQARTFPEPGPVAVDFRAVVRAPKPKTKALRGGERELFRNPDRLLLISGAVVRAPKPKTKALRGGERELFRNPDRLLLISGAVVRAPKPKTKALRGGEREPQAG